MFVAKTSCKTRNTGPLIACTDGDKLLTPTRTVGGESKAGEKTQPQECVHEGLHYIKTLIELWMHKSCQAS